MPSDRQNRVRILFGGDTGFGELWHRSREAKGKRNVLEHRGYLSMAKGLSRLIRRHDLVIANLETPLVDPGTVDPFDGQKRFTNPGDPERTGSALAEIGIHAVSLANNHAFDFGIHGLPRTLQTLGDHGITPFGAGYDLNEARKPFVWSAGSFKLHVIGCYWHTDRMRHHYRYYAADDRPGPHGIQRRALKQQIRDIRIADPEAFVVVFPHFGANYQWRDERQVMLARSMIDAGADLVIGHGAHMLQELELYKDRWIAYNLGNFIYGAPGRYQKLGAFPFSMACGLEVDTETREIRRLALYPIFCDNRVNRYRPRQTTPEETVEVRDRILVHELEKNPEFPHVTIGDQRKHNRIDLAILGRRSTPALSG